MARDTKTGARLTASYGKEATYGTAVTAETYPDMISRRFHPATLDNAWVDEKGMDGGNVLYDQTWFATVRKNGGVWISLLQKVNFLRYLFGFHTSSTGITQADGQSTRGNTYGIKEGGSFSRRDDFIDTWTTATFANMIATFPTGLKYREDNTLTTSTGNLTATAVAPGGSSQEKYDLFSCTDGTTSGALTNTQGTNRDIGKAYPDWATVNAISPAEAVICCIRTITGDTTIASTDMRYVHNISTFETDVNISTGGSALGFPSLTGQFGAEGTTDNGMTVPGMFPVKGEFEVAGADGPLTLTTTWVSRSPTADNSLPSITPLAISTFPPFRGWMSKLWWDVTGTPQEVSELIRARFTYEKVIDTEPGMDASNQQEIREPTVVGIKLAAQFTGRLENDDWLDDFLARTGTKDALLMLKDNDNNREIHIYFENARIGTYPDYDLDVTKRPLDHSITLIPDKIYIYALTTSSTSASAN